MKKTAGLLMAFMICVGVALALIHHIDVQAADDDIASGYSGTCSWVIDKDGVLTISPSYGTSGTLGTIKSQSQVPWYDYRKQVTKVYVVPGVATAADCFGLFYEFENCTEMDIKNLNTSYAKSMKYMFYRCINLTNVDLSNFNTANVTNMESMFCSCSSLTSLDLSSFNTGKVTYCPNMFYNCATLTELDLSNFNTANVTNMSGMFSSCTSLETLDVSSFDTSSVSVMTYLFKNCKALTYLNLSGWVTTRLNSNYGREAFSGCDSLKKVELGPTYFFRCSLFLNNPPNKGIYNGNWVREDLAYGPCSAQLLYARYTPEMSGTWVWAERTPTYDMYFRAYDADTGAMQMQTYNAADEITLPKNLYNRFGYVFDHWTDYRGHEYHDGDTIPAGTYEIGDTIYLVAVFVPRDTSVTMKDGAFEFSIRGGEKASFDSIPAGTSYQVYEETPDGWVLINSENVSGVIEPLEESAAIFTNKYQPGTTSVQFTGTKTLDGQTVSENAYKFVLLENGKVIQEKDTLEGGFIQFDVITYTVEDLGGADSATYTYTIREVDPKDDAIDYDTHEEEVTVVVTKNVSEDGTITLNSEVTYDNDGIVFKNKTRPGSLYLTKNAEGVTDANGEDVFTFDIHLYNENGLPSDESIYWYIEGGQGTGSGPEAAGTEN